MRQHASNVRTSRFVLRTFAKPAKVHAFQTRFVLTP